MNEKSAIGYCRISVLQKGETESLSVELQAERITAYCQMRGFDLVRVYRDLNVSGAVPISERPEGGKLMQEAKGIARHVVALKLDRCFRDAADCLATTRQWESDGLALHIVDLGGNSIDGTSAAGRFMLTVLAGAAEMERNLIRERTTAALGHKRKNGEKCGGFVPMGFDVVRGDESNGRLCLVPNEHEQGIITEMLALRQSGKTLYGIAQFLNAANIPTKRGKMWTSAGVLAVCNRAIRERGENGN